MSEDEAIMFMNDMAVYWDRKALATKEDVEFQAASNNGRLCREVSNILVNIGTRKPAESTGNAGISG